MTPFQRVALIGLETGPFQTISEALKQAGALAYPLAGTEASAPARLNGSADVTLIAFPSHGAELRRLAETSVLMPVVALVDDDSAGLQALAAGAWDFLCAGALGPETLRQVLVRAGAQQQRMQKAIQHVKAGETASVEKVANRLLNRVIAVANASLDSANILELVCRELLAIFDVPQVVAFMLDETRTHFAVVAERTGSGALPLLGKTASIHENAIYNYLHRYHIPLFIPYTETGPEMAAARDTLLCAGCGASMVVPLIIRDDVVGAVVINAYAPRTYTDDEFSLLASAGHAISQSLENSLLHRQLALHNAELEHMVEARTAELRQMSERVSAILNGASDAIVLLGHDGAVEEANLAFTRLFGYEADAYRQLMLGQLVEEPQRAGVSQAMQQVLTDGHAHRVEVQARRSDGTVFDADMALARINQGQYHVVCSLRDITQLKEIERIKDRFVSMVSHELRTPITTIVLSAGALKQYFDRMTDEQRRQAIARTDQQAQVLAELVETILDLSRLEGRLGKRATERVDVRALASATVDEFMPAATSKNQTLTLSMGEAPIVLLGESADFVRIWRNLISNAVKYTPPQGQITVRLSRLRLPLAAESSAVTDLEDFDRLRLPTDLLSGDYLLGQVADTGHGIPAEDFDRLFTRFQRGWASQSNVPGTGLGLALVREVLHLYGGDIDVVSAPGVGSVFSFWVPVGKGTP